MLQPLINSWCSLLLYIPPWCWIKYVDMCYVCTYNAAIPVGRGSSSWWLCLQWKRRCHYTGFTKFIVRHHIVASRASSLQELHQDFHHHAVKLLSSYLSIQAMNPVVLVIFHYASSIPYSIIFFVYFEALKLIEVFSKIVSCAESLYTWRVLLWNASAHNVPSDCSGALLQQSRAQVFHSQLIRTLHCSST